MPDTAARMAGASERAPLATVLGALREHGGLPSVGHMLGKLSALLESDTEAVQELANVILADVSLTQRLLRIANTIPYKFGPQAVTTVTRAIMLLGFNQVRSVTMSLVLLEGVLRDAADAQQVRVEFHQALLAGALARELLAGVYGDEAEEAGIAAMFRNVGRLLVAVYAPGTLADIRAAAVRDAMPEAAAARRLLGRSYEELTELAMREWSLPDRLMAAVQPLPPRIEPPSGPGDRVRAAAQFADEIAGAVSDGDPSAVEGTLSQVLARFMPAFAVERGNLTRLLSAAAARTQEFETACGLAPSASPVARLLATLPPESQLATQVVEPSAERDAVGRPVNGRAILLAGLADATDCLARGSDRAAEKGGDVNDVIRIVLEAMHTGLGFARTALVLRDSGAGVYRTRAAFGSPRPPFSFPVQGSPNLFTAALAHASDLHIANVGAEKVRPNLPEWFARDFAAVRSFLLMPLVLAGKPVGFFYADRSVVDEAGPGDDELNLLRTLRNQVVLAMKAR